MVHNDSQGKPLGAALHHLPRALCYVQSLTSHILAKRSDLPLCVQYESFGFHDSGIVQLHPVPARGDHSDLQVSLAQDTQTLHHISCLNIFVTCCHSMPWFVASDSTAANRRHSLAGLFSLRLESWVSADACVDLALKSTRPCQNPFFFFFFPPACLQSSFKEIALQQLPKQSQWAECLQCWDSKALILVEDIRHSVFFPCFHWNFIHFLCNMKSSLPVNFYHGVFGHGCKFGLEYRSSASCSSEQMGTVQLCLWEGPINCRCCPPSSDVSRYAGLYLVCLTTSRPHIWSCVRHRLIPSISSRLLSLPGELKGERKRERESANWQQ